MTRWQLVGGALALLGAAAAAGAAPGHEEPSGSLSPKERLARRLDWFQDQKFGLLMHWGAYSQWGCIESWPLVEEDRWARPDDLPAWVERGKDIERFKRDYWALNRSFNPTRFEPARWAAVAKDAGMRYVVFTTKHHDGFTMWDTRQTDYRVTGPDCPFSRNRHSDVVREVFDAFRKEGFGIGAYFSKADWHHPDYWSPDAPARTRNPNYDTLQRPDRWARFVGFVHRQIEELVTGYGKIDILWLDAGQVRPPRQDIRMDGLVQMARSHQPDLIVVDRTVGGEHENYRTPEQEVPDRPLSYPWETCMTMGDQWSFKPHDRYKSTHRLVHLLVDVVAKGGNFLLNVGPQPDGQLPPEAVSRLQEIGAWMKVNHTAIYGTRPVAPYRQGRFAFTRRGDVTNALYLLEEGEPALPTQVTIPGTHLPKRTHLHVLGAHGALKWHDTPDGTEVEVPPSLAAHPPTAHAVTFTWRA